MFKALIIGVIIVLAVFIAKSADAQYYYNRCWGCYVTPPFVVGPPIIMVPPPVIMMPPPIVVAPPPPVVVAPQPVIVEQPNPVWYYNGRRCWNQYAGNDHYGMPMYIQACE